MPAYLVDDEASSAFHVDAQVREIPKYSICRGVDDVLQWKPPIRSRQLANALSYHYPLEESLQEKMQRAILDFFDSETSTRKAAQKTSSIEFKSPAGVQAQKLVAVAGETGPIISKPSENVSLLSENVQIQEVLQVWDIRTGELVKPKGRKRGLSPTTRQRVAENRGNSCAFHRKAKTQCDPTQCRQNKLYPGTTIGQKSAKGADLRRQNRRDVSPPGNEPEILNWPLTTGTSHGCNPVKREKRVKGPPPLSSSLPNLAPQRKELKMQLSNQDCHRPSSESCIDREGDHLSGIPSANTNGLPDEVTLLDRTNDLGSPLAENLFASSLHAQQTSDESKLFPTINSIDVSLGVKPATVSELSFEKNTAVQRDWISAEETYSSGDFNWVEDLMASDLTSWELDWSREEAGATATLTDLSSSPNTPFDFGSFGLDAAGGLLDDSQSHGLSPGQNFDYEHLGQATADVKSYIGELVDIPQVGSSQSMGPFVLSGSSASTLAPQACDISEPQSEAYEDSTDTALASPKAICSTRRLKTKIPSVAKSHEEVLDTNEWPRRFEELRHRRLTTDKNLPRENLGEYSSLSIHKPQSSRGSTGPVDDLDSMDVIPSTLTSGGKSARGNCRSRSRAIAPSYNFRDKLVDVSTINRADCLSHCKSLEWKRQDQVIVSSDIPASQAAPKGRFPKQFPASNSIAQATVASPILPESSITRPASAPWPSALLEEIDARDLYHPIKEHSLKLLGAIESDGSTFSPETTAISIEVLTTLLQDFDLMFTGFSEELYCPKSGTSFADVILLADVNGTVTRDFNPCALLDELRTSSSRLRLIRSVCRMNMDIFSEKRFVDKPSANTTPLALETGNSAKKEINGQKNKRSSDYSQPELLEYVKSVSGEISATPNPSGERLVVLICHAAAAGTFFRRSIVAPVKLSGLSPRPASHSVRWLDLDWRTTVGENEIFR